MIGWLWRTFVGQFSTCRHQWERLEEIPARSAGREQPTAWVYVLQCKACGEIGKRTIRP